jgi:hypothetical protein
MQEHRVPAHVVPVEQSGCEPPESGQHPCPRPPHVQTPLGIMLFSHVNVPVHDTPLQHAWSAPPHVHFPFEPQLRFEPQLSPSQQASPVLPHATHVPSTQAFPCVHRGVQTTGPTSASPLPSPLAPSAGPVQGSDACRWPLRLRHGQADPIQLPVHLAPAWRSWRLGGSPPYRKNDVRMRTTPSGLGSRDPDPHPDQPIPLPRCSFPLEPGPVTNQDCVRRAGSFEIWPACGHFASGP